MQLDKSQILDMLKSRGDNDQASKAASDSPTRSTRNNTPICCLSSASTHKT
jgi:hypothetical protein